MISDTTDPEFSTFADIRRPTRWRSIGSLIGIYVRLAHEPAPRPVSCIQAIAGYGLAGDRHASPQSPRQLLIAGEVAYQRWALPDAALRENLLVDFSTECLQSGDLVHIGNEVIIWMTFNCEPCSLLERRCPGTLKTIGGLRGMLARVVRGGQIQRGDTIQVYRSSIPPISDDWQSRVLQVARTVPEGHRISFRQLADLAGVPSAYCRAFPRVLSRLPATLANRVASNASASTAKLWTGNELFDVRAHLPPSGALQDAVEHRACTTLPSAPLQGNTSGGTFLTLTES
ncbi:MOSC domain-containing protein [Hydrogenophaga sp.]|uniref:MOSC domain-containing protein n=1 Tax=Hydrogenophaga sp. TaxID=1904254 RepID=UPI00345B72A7